MHPRTERDVWMPHFSVKQFWIALTTVIVVVGLVASITHVQNQNGETQRQLTQLAAEVQRLAAELDRTRSYALNVHPTLRTTPGRKAHFVDREGWPELRLVLHQDKFGAGWPFRAREVTIHGTLFGLCLAEVDGELWGLNGLAGMSGYPLPDIRILKPNPATPAADCMDAAPVRDVALRLVEQLKAEHIERPYATP